MVSMNMLDRLEELKDDERLGPKDPETGRRPGGIIWADGSGYRAPDLCNPEKSVEDAAGYGVEWDMDDETPSAPVRARVRGL